MKKVVEKFVGIENNTYICTIEINKTRKLCRKYWKNYFEK